MEFLSERFGDSFVKKHRLDFQGNYVIIDSTSELYNDFTHLSSNTGMK